MVQLHILEAVLELFFLACPAANKRHKLQLINRAVPNLAVTTFLVGGSPLHPSFLFSSLHAVGRLEKLGARMNMLIWALIWPWSALALLECIS